MPRFVAHVGSHQLRLQIVDFAKRAISVLFLIGHCCPTELKLTEAFTKANAVSLSQVLIREEQKSVLKECSVQFRKLRVSQIFKIQIGCYRSEVFVFHWSNSYFCHDSPKSLYNYRLVNSEERNREFVRDSYKQVSSAEPYSPTENLT